MTYTTRRTRVGIPRREMYVPNLFGDNLAPVPLTGNLSATTLTANRAYYTPFLAPYDAGLVSISVYCGAQSGQNFDFGLYDAAGTRLASRGSTAITTTGVRTWTPTNPLSLRGGDLYYAAFGANSATPTFVCCPTGLNRNHLAGTLIQSTAFALPSSWTTPVIANNVVIPLLRLAFSS